MNETMSHIVDRLQELVGPTGKVNIRTRRNEPDSSTVDKSPEADHHDGDTMAIKTPQASSPAMKQTDEGSDTPSVGDAYAAGATCDRCNDVIDGTRMKCEVCPNFDYCSGCFMDANRIHPGHTFKAMQGQELAPPGNYRYNIRADFAAMMNKDLPFFPCFDDMMREVQPEHMCGTCAELSGIIAFWHQAVNNKTLKPSRVMGLEHIQKESRKWSVRVTKLAEATALGCPFCSYFLEKLWGPGGGIAFSYRAERPWFMKTDASCQVREKTMARAMFLSSKLVNDRFDFRIKPVVRRHSQDGVPCLEKIIITGVGAYCGQDMSQECFGSRGAVEIELFAFAIKDTLAQSIAPAAPNTRPGSDQGLAQAEQWLDDCLKNHRSACSANSIRLPKRVIDVSNPAQYRVVAPGYSDTNQYCTLSYQWGGPQDFCLTRATLERLMEGFDPAELPATLADAAKVARSLHVRYLWVDALCILQDDVEDKQEEIAMMRSIFWHSTVTIIGASTSSATTGFLGSTTDDDLGFWRSLIPLRYPVFEEGLGNDADKQGAGADLRSDSSTSYVLWTQILFMDDMEKMDYGVTKDPITSRSWCLQERILSHRVLSYGRWPMWRCNKLTTSDGGFYIPSDPQIDKADQIATLFLRLARYHKWEKEPDHFVRQKLLDIWYGIVADYTTRKLSDPMDRLPAIVGIASWVSVITKMEYAAGIWHQNAMHDLMWYADTREWLVRPARRRSPSWSWASVEYPITYGHIDAYATPFAEVLECSCDQDGPADGVITGVVRLYGSLRKLTTDDTMLLFRSQDMRPAVSKKANLVDFYRQMMQQLEAERDQITFTNEEVATTLPTSIFALIMFEHTKRIQDGVLQDGPFYSGLLLQPVQDHYERIGSFKHERTAWLSTEDILWMKQTIEIH